MLEHYYSTHEIETTLSRLSYVFSVTYAGYEDLEKLITNLRKKNLSNIKSEEIDLERDSEYDGIWRSKCCIASRGMSNGIKKAFKKFRQKSKQ